MKLNSHRRMNISVQISDFQIIPPSAFSYNFGFLFFSNKVLKITKLKNSRNERNFMLKMVHFFYYLRNLRFQIAQLMLFLGCPGYIIEDVRKVRNALRNIRINWQIKYIFYFRFSFAIAAWLTFLQHIWQWTDINVKRIL